MDRINSANQVRPLKLVLVPAIISLAVTLLRLAGELLHWSPRWFSTATGGIFPSGMGWLIGITWLAFPFGIYFALALSRAGLGPGSRLRALLTPLCGVAVVALGWVIIPRFQVGFPLILIWLFMAVAAVLQYFAWPELFRTLLFYGLAARIPVVVIMFLAMSAGWNTHYDYVGTPLQSSMSLVPRYLWLAFFPQLVFWVAFTVLLGFIGAAFVAAFRGNRGRRFE